MTITNSIGNIILGGFDYPEDPVIIKNDDIYSDSYMFGISDSLYKSQDNKARLYITTKDLDKLPPVIYLPNFSINKNNLLKVTDSNKLVNAINCYRDNYGVEYNVDFGLLRIIYSEEEFPFIYSEFIVNKVKKEYLEWICTFTNEFRVEIKEK